MLSKRLIARLDRYERQKAKRLRAAHEALIKWQLQDDATHIVPLFNRTVAEIRSMNRGGIRDGR